MNVKIIASLLIVGLLSAGFLSVSVVPAEASVFCLIGCNWLFNHYDANHSGYIEQGEASQAVADWFAGSLSEANMWQVMTWYFG